MTETCTAIADPRTDELTSPQHKMKHMEAAMDLNSHGVPRLGIGSE
jgi:hypothetical protein